MSTKIIKKNIKLCKKFKIKLTSNKNSNIFKWRDGSRFGVGADVVISYPYSYPTFGYREKPETKPILGQVGYYPSKLGRFRTGTHGYGFSCHVYSLPITSCSLAFSIVTPPLFFTRPCFVNFFTYANT